MSAKTLIVATALMASTVLGGCDQVKKLVGGKPAGQVVATVNGTEITLTELKGELGNFSSRDPKVMKAAQEQALQQIIMRDLLTQKAKEAKLDKSPEYIIQTQRGEQTLLAQLYERKLAAGVAAPSRQDAESYVSAHPGMFAQHKVMIVDQLIANPTGKLKPEQFKPLKTLDEIKGLFDSVNLPYRENVTVIDSLTADPRMMDQVEKMPAGEVFVVPQSGNLLFNKISETRVLPIHGDLAVGYATSMLRNQKAQELVRNQMIAMRTTAEKSIVYNAAYKPSKPFTPPKPTPAGGSTPAPAGDAAAAPTPAPAAPAAQEPAAK